MDVAWQFPKEELQGKALAPHILTKNVKFAVNFGQTDPWGEVLEDFVFVKNFPVENAVAGPQRPEKRSDCEVILHYYSFIKKLDIKHFYDKYNLYYSKNYEDIAAHLPL